MFSTRAFDTGLFYFCNLTFLSAATSSCQLYTTSQLARGPTYRESYPSISSHSRASGNLGKTFDFHRAILCKVPIRRTAALAGMTLSSLVGGAEQSLQIGEGIQAALVLLALAQFARGMFGAFEIGLG